MRTIHKLGVLTAAALATVSVAVPVTHAAQPKPAAVPDGAQAVATFQAGGEKFRIRLIKKADIERALLQVNGKEDFVPTPNGVVVRGSADVNVGYSWHIDPKTFEFADFTTEVCDGLPSFVERNEITSDRFCPWGAKVVDVKMLP
jgi:hypothetical protein